MSTLSETTIRVEERVVSVLTPAGDSVHTEFATSVFQMLLHTLAMGGTNLKSLGIQVYGSSIIPHSRNVLAATALENGSTHTLWIDSDMQVPREMLLHWLKRDEPIIGINAMMRRPPYLNCAQSGPKEPLIVTPDSKGLEKVHRTGFGVMWVATEVFRRIPMPWFSLEYIPEVGIFRGEDYVFCEKAREAGYEIYVDHDVSRAVKHVGAIGHMPTGYFEGFEPARRSA